MALHSSGVVAELSRALSDIPGAQWEGCYLMSENAHAFTCLAFGDYLILDECECRINPRAAVERVFRIHSINRKMPRSLDDSRLRC